jgi:nucleotide-binding universal stress UspA family protein
MQFFKKILFPVDLSHISPKIAPYVRELAKMFEAKVHLLFVARVFEHLTSAHLPNLTIDNLETEIAREAEKKLQEFMDTYFKSHGRKRIEPILFGSVADRIVKNSPVPVLTIDPYGRSEGR